MFIQQPVRVRARPNQTQIAPALIDSFLERHYKTRAAELSSDVVRVVRLEFLSPVLNNQVTQVDMLVSVEAQSIDLFNYFLRSFVKKEEQEDFTVVSVE